MPASTVVGTAETDLPCGADAHTLGVVRVELKLAVGATEHAAVCVAGGVEGVSVIIDPQRARNTTAHPDTPDHIERHTGRGRPDPDVAVATTDKQAGCVAVSCAELEVPGSRTRPDTAVEVHRVTSAGGVTDSRVSGYIVGNTALCTRCDGSVDFQLRARCSRPDPDVTTGDDPHTFSAAIVEKSDVVRSSIPLDTDTSGTKTVLPSISYGH